VSYFIHINTLLLIVVLLLLFGGGGFYFGGPVIGGSGLGLILLICLVIYFMGEVRDPEKNVRFREGMALMGAINGGGGFSEFADTTKFKLLHGLTETTYDMRKIHEDGSNNPLLQNGDQIFVPRRN
jgi:hypothetical protein